MQHAPKPSYVTRMLGIDDDAVDAMRLGWLIVEPNAELLVDRFYAHPGMAAHFRIMEAGQFDRLKKAQEIHWNALFLSRLDDEYEMRVRRAAIAHRRIGLSLSQYVLSYFAMADVIGREMADLFGHAPDVLARIQFALPKYIAFDIVLTMRVYDAVAVDA